MWRRLRFLLRRDRFERDLEEEMRFHLEMKAAAHTAGGAGPADARHQAERDFGNTMLLRERSREVWVWSGLDRLIQDLRYAARMLRNNPGFTAVAVLALGLGIGVNTTVFTFINVWVRPLPVVEPGRLVSVHRKLQGEEGVRGLPYPDYAELRRSAAALSGLAAFANVSLTPDNPKEYIQGQLVSGNFFSLLGVRAIVGRTLTPDDDRVPGAGGRDGPVVVLSYGCWRRRFGSDPAVVGRSLTLNFRRYTIVGVAPRDFMGVRLDPIDLWLPLAMEPNVRPGSRRLEDSSDGWLVGVGRLAAGVRMERAQAEMSVVATRLGESRPASRKSDFALESASSYFKLNAQTTPLALLLMTAVGLVLLVACANVANLLLARAAARQREIALRLSLGAGRARLVRQLLTESAFLGMLGGAAGLVFSMWLSSLVLALVVKAVPPEAGTFYVDLTPDARVFGYSLLVSLLAGIVFGLVPALAASRTDLVSAIKQGASGTGSVSRRGAGARDVLVVVQVSVCLVLLIGSGLAVRGLIRALSTDPGFPARDLVFVEFDPARIGYGRARTVAFERSLAERLEALPGVRSVAECHIAPLVSTRIAPIRAPGHETSQDLRANYNVVSPPFFETVGLPIVRGRTFSEEEAASGAPVMLVSEATAKRLWPGADAIGKTLGIGRRSPTPRDEITWSTREVIGVVRDSRNSKLWEVDATYLYLPFRGDDRFTENLLLRAGGDPRAVMAAVRREVQALESRMPLFVHTLDQAVDMQVSIFSMAATGIGALGLMALLLVAVGVYGVMAYAVSQRTREIGIRMALGARVADILRLVLAQSLKRIAVGLGFGMLGAAATSRVLSFFLFGVSPVDPLTFGVVPVFLAAVALLATCVPARKAARVDPTEALRCE